MILRKYDTVSIIFALFLNGYLAHHSKSPELKKRTWGQQAQKKDWKGMYLENQYFLSLLLAALQIHWFH